MAETRQPYPKQDQQGPSPEWLARKDACNNVPLEDVLEMLGAEPRQDGDSSKWKLPGLGNVLTLGQTWKNVNLERKGYGGVALVVHALSIRPGEAVMWIEKRWNTADLQKIDDELSAPREFEPPEPSTAPHAIEGVRKYLVQERGLPYSLVQSEMARGAIYPTHPLRTQDKTPILSLVNCVFLGPASAELRSIHDSFKGCCDGSDPDISGYRIPHAEGVALEALGIVEAAVDGMSYRALFPGRFTLSTNGAGRFKLPYRVAIEACDNGVETHLGHDADDAGDIGAQKIFNAFYLRKMLSARLKVPMSQVDEWLLDDSIRLPVRPVPQDMFFHNGWQEQVPEMHEILLDPNGEKRQWVPTGKTGPLLIEFQVARHVHNDLPLRSHTTEVTAKGFEYVTTKMGLRRDRPMHAKDWNDELLRLGGNYIRTYEEAARQNFAQGFPVLPPALEALRQPLPPVGTVNAGAEPATPPATEAAPVDVEPPKRNRFARSFPSHA